MGCSCDDTEIESRTEGLAHSVTTSIVRLLDRLDTEPDPKAASQFADAVLSLTAARGNLLNS